MEIAPIILINEIFQVVLIALLVKIIVLPFLPPTVKNTFTEIGKSIREQIKEGTKKLVFAEEDEDNFTDKFLTELFMPFTVLFIFSSFLFSYAQQIFSEMPALSILTGFLSLSLFVFSIPSTTELSELFSKTESIEQLEFLGKIIGVILILKLISLPIWIGIGLLFLKLPKVEDTPLLEL